MDYIEIFFFLILDMSSLITYDNTLDYQKELY